MWLCYQILQESMALGFKTDEIQHLLSVGES